MNEEVTFTHRGEHYEVRCSVIANKVCVKAFKSGKPANEFEYSLSIRNQEFLKTPVAQDAIHRLVEKAKSDVTQGRWDLVLPQSKLPAHIRHVKTHTYRVTSKDDEILGHMDLFQSPISEQDYWDFLEQKRYHGYMPGKFCLGKACTRDGTGKIWCYEHSVRVT